MPLITVITVCRNAASTIAATIASVQEQDVPGLEHLVVDGGSTDGTLDILRGHSDRLRYTSGPDGGIYDAMNRGIAQASGRWIHLLNADDRYVRPGILGEVMKRLDPHRLNYADICIEGPDGSRREERFDYRRWRLFISAYLPHPGMIVSREQYARIGSYSTRYRIAADHDFILRATRVLGAHRIPMLLTVMRDGGLSARDPRRTFGEFAEVTAHHGLPSPLAWALLRLKLLRARRST